MNKINNFNNDFYNYNISLSCPNFKSKEKIIQKTTNIAKISTPVLTGALIGAIGINLPTKSPKNELNDIEKYLNEHCNIYKEGEHTVIEPKNGGMIKLSELGNIKLNTIIRFNTPEQAREAAKTFVMEQFDLPIEQQCERFVAVDGNDIVGISQGDATRVTPVGLKMARFAPRTIDIYHNHPLQDSIDFPLSDELGDIAVLIRYNVRSITAYNHFGEFNRAEVIDSVKLTEGGILFKNELFLALDQYKAMALLGKEKGTKYISLRNIDKHRTVEQQREYEKLNNEYTNLYIELQNKKQKEYAKLMHSMYKEILPKFGVKYTTNYSNL